jgi:hypothetical protein
VEQQSLHFPASAFFRVAIIYIRNTIGVMHMANLNGEFLTIKEAMPRLKLSENSIRQYLSSGKLESIKIGVGTFLTPAECDRFNKERNPPGNPNLVRPSRKAKSRKKK